MNPPKFSFGSKIDGSMLGKSPAPGKYHFYLLKILILIIICINDYTGDYD